MAMQNGTPIYLEYKYLGNFRSSAKVPVHIKKTKHFNFFDALVSEYDILYKIFEYLSYKDLNHLLRINSSLAYNVDVELRKRLSPVLFSLSNSCYKMPDTFDINPSICVVLRELADLHVLEFNSYVCLHGDKKQTRKPVIEFVENDLIPAKCPISSIACRQVSSTFTEYPCFNGVIFPAIPNIKMSVFKITESNRKNLSAVLEENIGTDNNLICLLTYGLRLNKRNIKSVVSAVQNRQPGVHFALGGGYVKGMQTFNTLKESRIFRKRDLLCVSFSKTKNMDVSFNAYSIVIKAEATSQDEIQEYLDKLKKNYTPRQFTIAFRITCITRQDEVSKEIELLKNLFPGIEVLGFCGDGEIGWDCYDNFGEEENVSKKRKVETDVVHLFTTIIVLLTWGKPKVNQN